MKNTLTRFLAIVVLVVIATGALFNVVRSASTTAVLGNGVCINEILIDPSGDSANFDTDSNGTVDDLDEFLELYNSSNSTIDISGWEMWDSLALKWFIFPGNADDGTTLLVAGAYAVVVTKVQSGGQLPTMTNPDSLVFDANVGSAVMNNPMDNVVLYDPGEDEYIQLYYNGDGIDDPTSTYPGFSSTAVRVGSVEDFGYDEDGKSLTRYPSGDTNVVIHDSIPGAGNASPNAVRLDSFNAHRRKTLAAYGLISVLGVVALFVILILRRNDETVLRQDN